MDLAQLPPIFLPTAAGRGDHQEDTQLPHPELPEPDVAAAVSSPQHHHACRCTWFIFRFSGVGEFRKCQTPAATACTTTRMMASSPTLAPSSPTPGRGPVHGGCGLVASSGNPIPSIFLRRRAHPPDSPAGIKAVAWTLPPSTKEGVSSRRWRRPCSTSYFVVPAIRGVPLKTVPSPFCFFYYLLLLLLLIGLCMVQWIQHDASAAITCFLVYHPGTMGASSSSSIPSYCTTAGVHTPYSFWSISTSYCSSCANQSLKL
ncbi:uncharacterized protein [Aegilops tauschii subsp. strangulata]|uniref:uncharacterized protein isoform X2 n=1 Tax=Aegilops tauschii subsp. strangulata TaxID=200361 RepID=UPI001E1CAF21|nr:uncharacterized protein LOC109783788 isoform X2 [Aegilops tauschii subsp. strangulata]